MLNDTLLKLKLHDMDKIYLTIEGTFDAIAIHYTNIIQLNDIFVKNTDFTIYPL